MDDILIETEALAMKAAKVETPRDDSRSRKDGGQRGGFRGGFKRGGFSDRGGRGGYSDRGGRGGFRGHSDNRGGYRGRGQRGGYGF